MRVQKQNLDSPLMTIYIIRKLYEKLFQFHIFGLWEHKSRRFACEGKFLVDIMQHALKFIVRASLRLLKDELHAMSFMASSHAKNALSDDKEKPLTDRQDVVLTFELIFRHARWISLQWLLWK